MQIVRYHLAVTVSVSYRYLSQYLSLASTQFYSTQVTVLLGIYLMLHSTCLIYTKKCSNGGLDPNFF